MMPTLGAKIGEGRTAEIYTWGNHQVVKLFRADLPAAHVDYEAQIAQIVTEAGISAPAFGGVVEVNGRRGIIYEYVQSASMLTHMKKQPWLLISFARQFAEVHAAIHQRSTPGLPSQHERLERKILQAPRLSDDLRNRLIKRLEAMPSADTACHGDFHPDNILMSPHGLMVIDWTDAKRGSPAADLARTTILLTESALPANLNPATRIFFAIVRRIFYAAYLSRYGQLCPVSNDEIQAWIPLQAAARLTENIPEEEAHLLELAKKIDE